MTTGSPEGSAMSSHPRTRILCVDDEAEVLAGLVRHLGRRYEILTATSGAAALEQLKQGLEVVVIISDMRMPGLTGAEFLSQSRAFVPDAQRILLTGQTDLASAIAAINEGEIFRFLSKPCPPATLVSAIEAAVERHRSHALENTALRRKLEERQLQTDPRRRELLQALREALVHDGLHLHYQPIVDVSAGRVRGVECLARWQHSSFGAIGPATFIPLAEQSGDIVRLGQCVLLRACHEGGQLMRSGNREVAVNVSAKQLMDASFLPHLKECLAHSGLPAAALKLELTESALATDLEQLRDVLQQTRQLNVRIAVDDFGTGYSSLAYLSRLPIDVIKVDQTFVRDFHHGGKTIITAALAIARDFALEVIIEGVETAAMLRQVQDLGASLIQGYWFAAPMPAGRVLDWLRAFEGDPETESVVTMDAVQAISGTKR